MAATMVDLMAATVVDLMTATIVDSFSHNGRLDGSHNGRQLQKKLFDIPDIETTQAEDNTLHQPVERYCL